MTIILLAVTAFWLAYSNGANDNFKGVATLYGSRTTSYQHALIWSTITTFLGSLLSILLAEQLVKIFSGAGLVPDPMLGSAPLLVTIGLSAATTIFLATILGMPTSTTHALVGSLLGIAWVSSTLKMPWHIILNFFVSPLLLSPLVSIILTGSLYSMMAGLGKLIGMKNKFCVCLEPADLVPSMPDQKGAAMASVCMPRVTVDRIENCIYPNHGSLRGFSKQSLLDMVHYLSAGAVCFGRAVNDTPKIAALLLTFGSINQYAGLGIVALAMALGGVLQARRVAETLSRRITDLDPHQGMCANLVTAGLVLFASQWGMPVSTTHVACGSIFGIGLVNKKVDWNTAAHIGITWMTTLPIAALLSTLIFKLYLIVSG